MERKDKIMDIHIGYKEIATVILAIPLLKFLIPCAICLLAGINQDQQTYSDAFVQIGGKIGRKWYFFNNVIISLIFILLVVVCYFLSNWLMFLIALPYLIALVILQVNNHYKRINAIFDNAKLSVVFAVVYSIIFYARPFLTKLLAGDMLILTIYGIMDILSLCLLFIPNKKC